MLLELPLILAALVAVVRDRTDLVAENVALRQQLSALDHRRKRPRLQPVDRALWALLYRYWSRWREALVIVKPSTVVAWHRKGFKLFWCRRSRSRQRPGRPRIDPKIRRLIIEMASTNIGWGAPRIHGELRKLGFEVSQATVSRYMPKRPPRPGARQSWSTFLANHRHELLAVGFAVVPSPSRSCACSSS